MATEYIWLPGRPLEKVKEAAPSGKQALQNGNTHDERAHPFRATLACDARSACGGRIASGITGIPISGPWLAAHRCRWGVVDSYGMGAATRDGQSQ